MSRTLMVAVIMATAAMAYTMSGFAEEGMADRISHTSGFGLGYEIAESLDILHLDFCVSGNPVYNPYFSVGGRISVDLWECMDMGVSLGYGNRGLTLGLGLGCRADSNDRED